MPPLARTIDSQFLIRVILNEIGVEEREYFDRWLEESDKNKEEFSNLVLLWDKFDNSFVPPAPNTEEQWEKIREKLNSPAPVTKANNFHPVPGMDNSRSIFHSRHQNFILKERKHGSGLTWITRAAALIIISVSLFVLYKNFAPSQKPTEEITLQNMTPALKKYTLITEKGERRTFPLADGTIVYLNADSKLIYPNIFSDDSREVELAGEAYFSVVPDKTRPFKVISGSTITVVTGTEFNIKNRDNRVSVVVAKGSVKTYLKNSSTSVALTGGEMVSFTEKSGFSKTVKVNLSHYLSWRQDRFSFSHTPLQEVMEEIERYYNIQVVFLNDSVMKKRFTGTFNADSLEQIFSVISLTLDVKIDHNGRKVIIN
jgi:ferric-dicitrate binding protein FerR (iron transport regulator)